MNKSRLIIYLFFLFPFVGFSQVLVEAEYFIDSDPGFGNGTSIAIPSNSGVADLSFQADLNGVSNGVHILYVRVKDENDVWSLTGYRPFYYNASASSNLAPDIAAVEYFIDTDPGFGNGTSVPVGANNGAIALGFNADLSGVSNGVHILYVRTRDTSGKWSLTGYRPFYYNASSGQLRTITDMEYFWDEDPGFGNGIPINFSQPGFVVAEDLDLDFSGLEPGPHICYLRVRDETGVWSLTAWFEANDLPIPIFGCLDPTACNYNTEATEDDASCIYATGNCEECSGETDGTGAVVVNDSDNDGLCNDDEINIYNTDPLDADTDNDGLTDGLEVNEIGTSPTNPDTDGDGCTDDLEYSNQCPDSPLCGEPDCLGDLDENGTINSGDLGALLQAFGETCE